MLCECICILYLCIYLSNSLQLPQEQFVSQPSPAPVVYGSSPAHEYSCRSHQVAQSGQKFPLQKFNLQFTFLCYYVFSFFFRLDISAYLGGFCSPSSWSPDGPEILHKSSWVWRAQYQVTWPPSGNSPAQFGTPQTSASTQPGPG